MGRICVVVIAAIACWGTGIAWSGTCQHAYMAEGKQPSAFDGVNTTDTGFRSYYWAWGANPSDEGTRPAGLVDDGSGVAVNPGILWANSDSCSGAIEGAALLVESQTATEGGKLAIVVFDGAEADLDDLQEGTQQSVAEPLPVPAPGGFATGSDGFGEYVDVTLSWSVSGDAWALSNVPAVLAGYALYYVMDSAGGPVNDGDKALFTRMTATLDGALPFITDDSDTADGLLPASQTSCVVRIRPGEQVYFAVALILDGTGAAGSDPQADVSAVESAYVSACSPPASADALIFADGFESGDTTEWTEEKAGRGSAQPPRS